MLKAVKFNAALLAAVLCSSALAQVAARQFGIPGAGNLVLNVPATWRVVDKSIPDPAGVVIGMRPVTGDAWNLQITSVRADPRRPQPAPEALKERLQGMADKMLDNAVEKKATLVELRGKQAVGYYYSLTDKASKNGPDDYKYITQGTLLTGEITTVFTFLHRDPVPAEKEQVLRMLADATFAKGKPAAAAPRDDALQLTEKGDAYELAVPVSRLVMTIPKDGLERSANPAGTDHPRYFHFTSAGLNVSGWFEPAQGYSGIEEFWKKESAAWNKALPAPSDVSFSKVGNWDVVAYDLKLQASGTPAVNQSNIRAHWVQSGTWIDVHASITSRDPSAEMRGKLVAFLKTIQVKEKDK